MKATNSQNGNSLFISALVPGDVRRIEFSESGNLKEEILFSELKSRIRNIIEFQAGIFISSPIKQMQNYPKVTQLTHFSNKLLS